MQHSSVNTLFSNEEGGCGGYLEEEEEGEGVHNL